ncbi:VWA domain-containing protein [Methanolobus mangrovi]|uniref:VWA domain-containing protein n=1 Tax=Methanolobus mangrovi TaxID=3072977 RepID=A0AA51UJJ4_9EURY|nr:VIT domain-containing protein [Methanolobus mangrovi]WMW22871.1 VWA domain-containing protein [Methanolobus mangrovi]
MKTGAIKQIYLPLAILLSILLAASPAMATASVDYMSIDVDINNGYAVTTVEQKITSNEDEAAYDDFSIFKSEDAFISDFTIIIDGEEYNSEVLPKTQAKEEFEEAVSEGRSAGLLTDAGKDRFSYALNFEPHQSIIVRLTYEQALKKTLGEYEYTQPLRSYRNINNLSVNVDISSVNKILSLETPGFAEANTEYLSSTKGQVTYNSQSVPDSDLNIIFTTNNPALNGEMLFYETGGQGYMMHIFSPTEDDLGTKALNKDIIFVIDKSGSMSGEKMYQVKSVFSDIIYGLPANDRFNVIFFDGEVHTYSEQLMEANASSKKDSIEFVDNLNADGGTNINDALLNALGMFNDETENVPIIVFLTDGEPTSGVTSRYVIRENVMEANKVDVSIFSIAFGIEHEEYYESLRALSLENNGKAERFTSTTGAEEGISDFYATISTPLITDIEFSYNGKVSDIVNTVESSLFAGSDAIVLGKYNTGTSTISSEIKATSRSGTQEFNNQFTILPKAENSFIPRLWAYETINDLLDRIEVEGETDDLVTAVTDLSLEFEFVTPYTSLFVEIPETEKQDVTDSMPPGEMGMDESVVVDDSEVAEEAIEEMPAEEEMVMEEIPVEETAEEESPGFEALYAAVGIIGVMLVLRKRE